MTSGSIGSMDPGTTQDRHIIVGSDDPVAGFWSGRQFEPLVCSPDDDQETRHRKVQFARASALIVPAGVIWSLLYFAFGEPGVAFIPLAYSILTFINFAVLTRMRRFTLFRRGQQLFILVLPVLLQLALGGIVGSSVVALWSMMAFLMPVLFATKREATYWFVAFVVFVTGAMIARPQLTIENNLPPWVVVSFFVLNVMAVSTIAFIVLLAFVSTRTRLRELQTAYFKQDLVLRQSEKLATLGTLAAGIAHELNNPAAATRRAAEQLRGSIVRLEEAQIRLGSSAVGDGGMKRLAELEQDGRTRAAGADDLDPLSRSDQEALVEDWLDDHGVPDAWDLAPQLVAQGLEPEALESISMVVDEVSLTPALTWLAEHFQVHSLLHEVGEGSARISEIVRALKNYSFLDQAPRQEVDVHEGIDNTLVILRSKLKQGVTVRRDYCSDMPRVPAYGSELNQVWTNLLDNAVDAMGGKGTLSIRTRNSDGWAVIEIEDDGPGIPETIQPRIFDPFYTTKEPGKGTGLGLSTTHRIIVEKHGGTINVDSHPGSTRFTIRLPYHGITAGSN